MTAVFGLSLLLILIATSRCDWIDLDELEELWRRFLDSSRSEDVGSWPADGDRADCEKVSTRDLAYYDYRKLHPASTFGRSANCGQNRFTKLHETKSVRTHGAEDEVRQRLRQRRGLDEHEGPGASIVDGEHVSRVVGGKGAGPGSWPWSVAIGRTSSSPFCGGTLIGDRWVLTAAHCFDDEEMLCEFNVRAGTTNWKTDPEHTHVDSKVIGIYRHPDYDNDTSRNDVAVLKLETAIALDINGNTNSICLADHKMSVKVGTLCMAAGWGKHTELELATRGTVLQQVELPVLAYRNTCGKYDPGTLQSGMLCAGYLDGGKDTCQGDSGGPLIYQEDGHWVQLGITSFGNGCAREGYPGIYTDVGYHLSWIASVVKRYQ